ncbi:MAG: 5-oxoprolinase subunit PxpB [Candidatus Riflebacteria bacterium]|nr:5-oxoprolinase subunit PxpB [Candidatus Riflebacteria bacterium]
MKPPIVRLLPQGECGIVVELGSSIDVVVNRRVVALAGAIAGELAGKIVEVVPTYRSLLVVFDPLRVSRAALARKIRALAARAGGRADRRPTPERRRVVEIPVVYGGDHGPDLEFVAGVAGLTPLEVVAIHSSCTYRVHMLGFTPGFPYLGGMSGQIAAPRLEVPRERVPSGSVGIAGEQTGIYPIESPGGWRLIGRTPLRLFDPDRQEPFLVAAGDEIRFAPIDPEEWERFQEGSR